MFLESIIEQNTKATNRNMSQGGVIRKKEHLINDISQYR